MASHSPDQLRQARLALEAAFAAPAYRNLDKDSPRLADAFSGVVLDLSSEEVASLLSEIAPQPAPAPSQASQGVKPRQQHSQPLSGPPHPPINS